MNHDDWWRTAVIYQVYPRSFADNDGDGIGDLPGITSRLDYLAELGIDAIWVSPFYASPLHDGGYDVADFRAIDPRLGTMDDLDALVSGLHARGMRLLMDIVPNHTSSEHAWFQAALAAGPGSREWDRYIIREGNDGQPPNNWRSVFHGAGWSPMPGPDGETTGWWYLHLFDTTQPDLNWENEEVRAEFDDILRWWFDRGVDGFRIDVAHGLIKQAGLPDFDYGDEEPELLQDLPHAPFWDQDGVHDIYRRWRRIADAYSPARIFCGETWVPHPERLARYQRADELHTSFNFGYYEAGYDAERMADSIDATIANHATVGAPPTWVLSNHDVVRHRTRFAPGFDDEQRLTCAVDEETGLWRARAATLFMLALPGSAYIYQGEELGLTEVRDLDPAKRQDPAWARSGGTDGTRDGCRVPIPWSGDHPSYGFGSGSASWLPQPQLWAHLSVAAQAGVEGSTLEFYRRALNIRRAEQAFRHAPLTWLERSATLLAFERWTPQGSGVRIALNFGTTAATLPADWGTDVLIASGDQVAVMATDAGEQVVIGSDTAVWLRAR